MAWKGGVYSWWACLARRGRAGGREWLGPAEVKQRKGPWETCPYDLGGEQCVTKPVAVLVNR